MSKIANGMFAGLAATAVLSVMMMVKSKMGVMPELDVIHMLSGMMGGSLVIGWLAHFMIGIVAWGAGFAALNKLIPGANHIVKGIVFGIAAWSMMMIAVMPMAGAGLFGLKMGMMAPVMTFMLHVIFGAVLGAVFSLMKPASQLVTA